MKGRPEHQSDNVRKPYPGELEYFKKHPHVGGMAAEDNRVILNPYSPLSREGKDQVVKNEMARILMRTQTPPPDFEITPQQNQFFSTINNGNPYGSENDIRSTIIARIVSGDSSAQVPTKAQIDFAKKIEPVIKALLWGGKKI